MGSGPGTGLGSVWVQCESRGGGKGGGAALRAGAKNGGRKREQDSEARRGAEARSDSTELKPPQK